MSRSASLRREGARLLLGLLVVSTSAAAKSTPGVWLEELRPLLPDRELRLLDSLQPAWRREAFARELLEFFDPFPETAVNEAVEEWGSRLAEAERRFPRPGVPRALLLLLGRPHALRAEICQTPALELEIWTYSPSGRPPLDLYFERSSGAGTQAFRGARERTDEKIPRPGSACAELERFSPRLEPLRELLRQRSVLPDLSRASWDFFERSLWPEAAGSAPPVEWQPLWSTADGFHRIRLELVPPELEGPSPAGWWVDGECVQPGQGLIHRFTLRIEGRKSGRIERPDPLAIERELPQGPFELRLRWTPEGGNLRWESTLSLPPGRPSAASTRINRAPLSPELLLAVPTQRLSLGRVRVEARVRGPGVARVEFGIDGKPVLTRSRPPFEVEIELGKGLRPRRIHARAYDSSGRELVRKEQWLNAGSKRTELQFQATTQTGEDGRKRYRLQAEVEIPRDQQVRFVAFSLGEDPVGSLDRPPYILEVAPPERPVAFLRAVLQLEGGLAVERVQSLETGTFGESLEVDFVELHVSATDRNGQPVERLEHSDLEIFEGSRRQTIRRLERSGNLPIHFALLLDTSASMAEELPTLEQAALRFFERVLRRDDRAVVLSFGDRIELATAYTGRIDVLAGALASLKAQGGTRLYDAIAEGIHQTAGIRGPRAVLVLTDGVDSGSQVRYPDLLEYARHIGTPLYTLGLGVPTQPPDARAGLERLARETGGLSFFFDRAREADRVYQAIESDLRSQWLVAYQSDGEQSSSEFRPVQVRSHLPGIRLRAPRGYSP